MIEQKVLLDQVEVTRNGCLQVRLIKAIVDSGNVLFSDYHRTMVPPGVDPDDQLAAVNAHLSSMAPSWPAIGSVEWDRVRRLVASEHTVEVVNSYRAAEEAARAAPEGH